MDLIMDRVIRTDGQIQSLFPSLSLEIDKFEVVMYQGPHHQLFVVEDMVNSSAKDQAVAVWCCFGIEGSGIRYIYFPELLGLAYAALRAFGL
ncbi:hypothetical protein Tco_0669458 [Tanacetum coccineum]